MLNDQGRLEHLQQANRMYDHVASQLARTQRAVIAWGILLVILAFGFGALTTAPFDRIGVAHRTAYLLGVILHLLLGLSKVGWQWADAHRRKPLGIIFRIGVVVLVLTILIVAYFRADLQVERGYPPLAAYLVSFFVALLEIVGPLVVGTFLGDAVVQHEELRRDLDWCAGFRRAMGSAVNPDGHWHDMGASLRHKIQDERSKLENLHYQRENSIASHDRAAAREIVEQIKQAEREIQHHEELYSLVKQFYPGSDLEFENGVNTQLGQLGQADAPSSPNQPSS